LEQSILQNPYMNARRLSVLLDMSERALQLWREHGKGPRYEKIEGRILYRVSEIDAFLRLQNSGTVNATAQNATTAAPLAAEQTGACQCQR
jgi:hypothetical protein